MPPMKDEGNIQISHLQKLRNSHNFKKKTEFEISYFKQIPATNSRLY